MMNGSDLVSGMRTLNNGLLDLIADLPSSIDMVEVGCYAGESTLMFLQSGKVKRFHAVDPWEVQPVDVNDPMKTALDQMYSNIKNAEISFIKRVIDYSLTIHKTTFEKADLPLVDFVYIDANHTYESVKRDIELALSILKPNGIIAGHDYYNEFTGVIKAVDEIFGKPDKVYSDTSWIKHLKN
jgi:predicted O-methyltransferase YrrM